MTIESLRELWRFRELFYFLAWRDIKLRYRQTLFGGLWALAQPFFTMVVFTIFFGGVFNVPTDGVPYPIFYFAALLPWLYFSSTITLAGSSLVVNGYLLTKIYFPRLILPASSALTALVDFVVGSAFLLAMMFYYGMWPTWKLLLWPLLVLPLTFLSVGIGIFLAAANVKYRDVKYVVTFLLQLLLFASPIIYSASRIPVRFRPLMSLNPLAGIIEAFRASCIPGRPIDWSSLGVSNAITIAILVCSLLYFQKAEREFSDII
jgi:lipopolysaccharide transport system permease protein